MSEIIKIGRRKCPTCSKFFIPDNEPYVLESVGKNKGRYFHKTCYGDEQKGIAKEEDDKRKLYAHIEQETGEKINQKSIIMINKYRKDFDYTYSGMLGSLVYLKNVKKQDFIGIGIIPHIYDEARKYYQSLSKKRNINKNFNGQAVKVVTITSEKPKPKRGIKNRKEISMEDI